MSEGAARHSPGRAASGAEWQISANLPVYRHELSLLRRPTIVALALSLALGASGCDSGGAEAGPPPTTTRPPTPNAARRLAPLPISCPAPTPHQLSSFGDYGNLTGSRPVWAGLYANFDARRGGYRIPRDAPRTPYGWRIKVL